jgi:hypothetical protein
MLPGIHGKSGLSDNGGNVIFTIYCVLIPLLTVGVFVYFSMEFKLFETASAGGSILAMLKYKKSNYVPRGYKLTRPTERRQPTILDKHRGRTDDALRSGSVNLKNVDGR